MEEPDPNIREQAKLLYKGDLEDWHGHASKADLDELERFVSSDYEHEQRRIQILRLRARRLSEVQIGQLLKISHTTVSRDLAWIRKHWRELLGPQATFNREEFLGETLALYQDIESTAMADSAKSGVPLKDKVRCLRAATLARREQVILLQDIGMLERSIGTLTLGLPTAAQIQAGFRAASLDPHTTPRQLTDGS